MKQKSHLKRGLLFKKKIFFHFDKGSLVFPENKIFCAKIFFLRVICIEFTRFQEKKKPKNGLGQ